jgi:hypothetical protein
MKWYWWAILIAVAVLAYKHFGQASPSAAANLNNALGNTGGVANPTPGTGAGLQDFSGVLA